MGGHAGHRYVGLRWERVPLLVLIIRDTFEKVSLIRQRILTAQSRQKSYGDVRHRPLEFEVGDHVFLKVMPKMGVSVGPAYR